MEFQLHTHDDHDPIRYHRALADGASVSTYEKDHVPRYHRADGASIST